MLQSLRATLLSRPRRVRVRCSTLRHCGPVRTSIASAPTRAVSELPAGVLARARVVADDLTQARQLGELQWSPQTPAIELGDLLTGRAELQRKPVDITLFDLTGLGLQDLTVARLIHRRAMDHGFGTSVSWPW